MEKGDLTRFVALFLIILSFVWTSPAALAHLGVPIDSGWAATPPTINGNIAIGEWSTGTVRNFTLEMRTRTTGALNRTLNGRLCVMNDWSDLYLAVQIFKDDYEAQDFSGRYNGLALLFDANADGVLSVGDNGEGVTTWVGSPFYSKNDLYYAGGGFWDADVYAGKTNDGSLAWSHTNPVQGAIGNWTFEMMIPLVGSDGANYDFAITTLPKTVGFKVWFQEPSKGLDGVYPDDPAITKNIEEISNAATFGDLTIYPLYTLTTSATAGGTTNPVPGAHQYPYKTNVSVTAIPNAMYELDHWELDTVNVGAANPYTVMMDQNHTLKAVFHALYALTITTTAGGTTDPTPGMHIYPNGTLVSVTAISNAMYELDHWELDTVNVGAANPYTVTMDKNHTLKAVFHPLYALTITTTTGGTTSPVPGTYIYPNGALVSVTAAKDLGYEFDHWKLDTIDVGANNPYQVTMNQNHTLEAVFVKALSVSISPPNANVYVGDPVAFSSVVTGGTPAYSYQWYVNSGKVSGATSASWTFIPSSAGIYYVCLNVTDTRGRIAISNNAKVVAIEHVVGGYAVSAEKRVPMAPIACYAGLLASFGLVAVIIRRKKK